VRSRRRGIQHALQTRDALARRKAEQLKAEIRQDLEAVNSYMAKHGSFAEMVRRHHRRG
jgi:hypothetical protein